MLLEEHYMEQYKGGNLGLKDFLDKKVGQDGIEKVDENTDEILITIDGYIFGIDKETYEIERKSD